MQPMHIKIPPAALADFVHCIICSREDKIGREEKEMQMQMNLRFLSRMLPRRVSQREMELAYLNQSTSLIDLEYREREIDSGRFRVRNH